MIKRVYCKSKLGQFFKKGEIYETVRRDDNFTGDLEIFIDDGDIGAIVKVANGELIDNKHFKLIRHCQEEYMYKGTWDVTKQKLEKLYDKN